MNLNKALGENQIQSITIENCNFRSCTYALYATIVYDVRVQNNLIEAGTNGIYITSTAVTNVSSNGLIISYNVIEGLSGKPIYFGACSGTCVDNNYFENNPNEPDIDLTAGSYFYWTLAITNNDHNPSPEQVNDTSYYPIVIDEGKIIGTPTISISNNNSRCNRLVTPTNIMYSGFNNKLLQGTFIHNQTLFNNVFAPAGYGNGYIQPSRADRYDNGDGNNNWKILKLTPNFNTNYLGHPFIIDINTEVTFVTTTAAGSSSLFLKLQALRDSTGALRARVITYDIINVIGARTSSVDAIEYIKEGTSTIDVEVVDDTYIYIWLKDVEDTNTVNSLVLTPSIISYRNRNTNLFTLDIG
jgi:hypothetical protein